MSNPLTPQDLEAYLSQHAINGELIYLDVPTPTVQTAADAVGVEPGQIIKTLLFLAKEDPVLVIANGTARVEWRMLAAYLGISRRKVNMADPATVLALTGYPVGGVPPLGHKQQIRVIMEPGVLDYEWVFGGGGTETALVRVKTQELADHLNAEIVDLQAPPKE
jgi:Cys-tRNA(Pro) deacylase